MGKKLTAAYCRTATADEIAMRAQERQIREYAEKHGYGKPAFYRDCGQSGATLDRPALNALTADIKAGKIGTVVTADASKNARLTFSRKFATSIASSAHCRQVTSDTPVNFISREKQSHEKIFDIARNDEYNGNNDGVGH
ncbi:MAG: recombinase family protein [Clostridiales Family XIII bacterium]|jgi:DNA invertase Pin-like site-specific DNA recombinase|nr:recombinase family protein [Clostridiales Family XIII bacterium]